MKIYLVLGGFDYEGSKVVACLATREEAFSIVEKIHEKKRRLKFGYDYVKISEWSVGEIVEKFE